jgi:hypothetical protein
MARMFSGKKYLMYLLLTLKSLKDTVCVFAQPFFLVALIIFLAIVVGIHSIFSWYRGISFMQGLSPIDQDIVENIFHILFFMMVCLAARPSTELKDKAYFLRYLYMIWYVFLYHVIWILFHSCFFMFTKLFIPHFHFMGVYSSEIPSSLFLMIEPYFLSPWGIFFTLFLIDSGRSKKFFGSFVRAGKMIFYNYPLCFLLNGLFFIMDHAQLYILGYRESLFKGDFLLHDLYSFIITLLAVVTFTNVYVKKVHEQFDRYFPR